MSSETERDEPSALRVLWAKRGFRDLLIGQAASGLGDWMATVALMTVVLDITGSSTAVGGVLVLRLAPTAIAGPLATRLSRDWDRKRTMLAMDAARIGVLVVLPLIHALWWVYTWAFLLEVAGLVFLPARDSSVSTLTDGEDLPLANGLVLGSSYGTIPLGAGAFAAIDALTGSSTIAFWIDAATFAISFLMILSISMPDEPTGDADDTDDDSGGFRRAFRIPLVRAVTPIAALVAFGLGALFSLGIVFVQDVLDASNTEFAVLVALFGVGAGVGLAALHLAGVEPTLPAIRVMVLSQGLVVAGMSLSPTIELAFVGALLFGAATAATLSTSMSLLQESLETSQRTLAFTAFHVVIRAGIAVGAIGTGIAADLVGDISLPVVGAVANARLMLVLSGLLVVASAASGWNERARAAQ